MTDVFASLGAVREEVERLAALTASVALPTQPIAVEDHRDGPLRVWYDSPLIRVHTTDGGVFISGHDRLLDLWPDWSTLPRDEARRLGSALLAAAADVSEETP